MVETEDGGSPERTRRVRRTQHERKAYVPTEGQTRANGVRSSQLRAVGKILPGCPMTPNEVAEQWGIGGDDALEVTLKILKTIPGEKEPRLIQSIPLVQYDGEAMARNFGPGNYYLRPASGAYARNSAKVPVSDELARSCGFGKLPVTAQDVTAERTIRNAAQAPVDPVDLLAAVQQVVRRELDERDRGHQGPAQNVASFDPMAAMQTQMNQMTAWMAFMDQMEARTQARVERRMGLPAEEPANQNSTLLETLLPMGLKILDRMTSGPVEPQAVRVPPGYQLVPIQPRQTLPAGEAATTQENRPMVTLTQEEAQAVAQAVAMLKPYAQHLIPLATSPATDDQIAEELAGYIGENMIPSFTALAKLTEAKGPEVLRAIHEGLVNDRWAAILPKIVKVLE